MQEVNGVPYPETGDDVQLTSVLSAMASGIAERLGDNTEEWITLPLLPGFGLQNVGQELQYIVVNGVVYIKGSISGDFPSGEYTSVTSSALPVEFRPKRVIRFGAMGSGMRGYCGIQVDTLGLIKLGWHDGGVGLSAPSWISASCSYPVNSEGIS